MKALSITEPYASLIREGMKSIETRSWRTAYRGPLLIHASATRIPKEYRPRNGVDCYTLVWPARIGEKKEAI